MRVLRRRIESVLWIGLMVMVVPSVAVAGDDDYVVEADEVSGFVDRTATVTVTLDSEDGADLAGYSVALCHDSDFVSLDDDGVVNGQAVEDASFLFASSQIVGDEGWTVGTALTLGTVLAPAADYEMYVLTYDLLDIGETSLEFCEIGTPSVRTTVVLDVVLKEIGVGEGLTAIDGGISITKLVFPEFVRGDCNNDGFLGLADGVRVVNVVFNEAEVDCVESCNVDNADKVDVEDAIALFNYLFLEAAPPAAPFPGCGTDEDADGEPVVGDCEASTCD